MNPIGNQFRDWWHGYSGLVPKPKNVVLAGSRSTDDGRMPNPNYRPKRQSRFRRKRRLKAYNYGGMKKELKFHDFTCATTATTGGAVEDTILNIAAGTGESQRVGRKIFVKGVHFRGHWEISSATLTDSAQIVRVIFYVDKQANGATAAVLDLLEAADIERHYNLLNVPSRFKILWDHTMNFPPTAGAYDGVDDNAGDRKKFVSRYMPVNKRIDYSAGTGAITELCCNNIGYMVFIESTNPSASFNGFARVRFYD